jgi:hypothetical protein
MATTAPTTLIRPRREMQEVKAPEQFQFNKIGQVLAGVLLAIEPKEVRGKQVPEYLFVEEGGKFYTCLATADLEKKMSIAFHQLHSNPLGHTFEIRYEKDDSSFQKADQSAMKVFKVSVSKGIEPGFEYLGAA